MTPRSQPSQVSGSAADSALNDLVEEIVDRLQAGEPVDFDEYRRRHPEQAEKFDEVIPGLKLMAELGLSFNPRAAAQAADPDGQTNLEPKDQPKVLGGFRVLGEIGRGGMGIVYEAVQVSLGRRVALKVLTRASALEPSLKARFELEARAAALLHHPHIVPVYAVDLAGDLPFYAMQLIRGVSLATVISELRGRGREGDAAATVASGEWRAVSEDTAPKGPNTPAQAGGTPRGRPSP
jgi:eukaryotic-like serine/threonine-protein kinase